MTTYNVRPLIWLKKQTFKNSYKNSGGKRKTLIIVITTIFVLAVILILSVRILLHFKSVPIIGDYLARQLLNMCYITVFGMVIFSSINTAIINLYISKDLELLHSSPLDAESIFVGRSLVSVFDSSWMVLLFLLPVLSAYGLVYKPGALFYLKLIAGTSSLIFIGGFVGIVITLILVYALPARRVRDVIVILGILFFVVLYILFRTMKPEHLVNPDAFMDMAEYLSYISSPYLIILPSRWVTEVLWTTIERPKVLITIPELLIYNTLLLTFVFSLLLARHLYKPGFFKSLEARGRHRRFGRLLEWFSHILTYPYPQQMKAIVEKDIRLFFRDNTQWTQLLLLCALIFVYIYNFSVLPLHKSPLRIDYLQSILAFLNLGLTSFIISALGARFVYPSISIEGEGFWLIKSSPITISKFVIAKFVFYFLIFTFISLALVITSNLFLNVDKTMMSITVITTFLLSFAITGLAIGFGCSYPVFRFENIANIVTGFGAFSYMLISSLLIVLCIIIEAGPIYKFFLRQIELGDHHREIFRIVLSIFTVGAICFTCGIYAIKIGIKKLEALEHF